MFCKPREKNAPGLASFERARAMIGALRKILTDPLVCLRHLLLWYLGLFFRLLGNYYQNFFLRSCMMQMHKYSCIGALER
jgi:hypothetical protein